MAIRQPDSSRHRAKLTPGLLCPELSFRSPVGWRRQPRAEGSLITAYCLVCEPAEGPPSDEPKTKLTKRTQFDPLFSIKAQSESQIPLAETSLKPAPASAHGSLFMGPERLAVPYDAARENRA